MRSYKLCTILILHLPNIMLRYGENASITATIDGEILSVPLDPDNVHYASHPCMGRRRRQRDPSSGVMLHATKQTPVQAGNQPRRHQLF